MRCSIVPSQQKLAFLFRIVSLRFVLKKSTHLFTLESSTYMCRGERKKSNPTPNECMRAPGIYLFVQFLFIVSRILPSILFIIFRWFVLFHFFSLLFAFDLNQNENQESISLQMSQKVCAICVVQSQTYPGEPRNAHMLLEHSG